MSHVQSARQIIHVSIHHPLGPLVMAYLRLPLRLNGIIRRQSLPAEVRISRRSIMLSPLIIVRVPRIFPHLMRRSRVL